MGKYNRFSSIEFSKLYLMNETKIITLSIVALNKYRKYLRQLYLQLREGREI